MVIISQDMKNFDARFAAPLRSSQSQIRWLRHRFATSRRPADSAATAVLSAAAPRFLGIGRFPWGRPSHQVMLRGHHSAQRPPARPKSDQDQVLDIPRSRVWTTANNSDGEGGSLTISGIGRGTPVRRVAVHIGSWSVRIKPRTAVTPSPPRHHGARNARLAGSPAPRRRRNGESNG
jgi:hypothetical protein